MACFPVLSRRFVLLGGLALAAIRPAAARVGMPEGEGPSEVQRRFGATLVRYAQLARMEKRPEKREALMVERGIALREALGGELTFDRWLAAKTITFSETKGGVVAIFLFFAESGVLAGMSNQEYGSPKLAAPIDPTSPLGERIQDLKDRDTVLLSGRFFPHDGLGLSNGMPIKPKPDLSQFDGPTFLAEFEKVERPAWLEDLSANK